MRIVSDEHALEPPMKKFKNAIGELKNDKAAKKDNIPAELLKMGIDHYQDLLCLPERISIRLQQLTRHKIDSRVLSFIGE